MGYEYETRIHLSLDPQPVGYRNLTLNMPTATKSTKNKNHPAYLQASVPDSATYRKVRAVLIRWYRRNARSLPWRETKDPYAIWVSEIMLQQTQVKTVIPYYKRFMKEFPEPQTLAEASEDQVLSAWSGLGYYRRARLLHAGVREVVARYGAKLPEDPLLRRSLPGIGAYTAGAIGSIAFNRPEPIVDGNVARVFARLFGIYTPLGRSDTEKRLWAYAEGLVKGSHPGDFNQALMELGATVCTKRPECERCPVKEFCYAYRIGHTEKLPVPRVRKAPIAVDWVAVVPFATESKGKPVRFWLVKGEQRLFGGLWSLPVVEGKGLACVTKALTDAGIVGRVTKEPATSMVHVLSHRKLRVELWLAQKSQATSSANRRVVSLEEALQLGISTLTRKLLQAQKQLRL